MSTESQKAGALGFLSRCGSPKLVVAVAVSAILGSAVWIYHFEFGSSDFNEPLHQAVGQMLAEQTARATGNHGQIVVVTMDGGRAPDIRVQMTAFESQLKASGAITIMDKVVLDPGDNPKYRPGSGLSAKRFLKIARKHPNADAIVSFVGAPEISPEDLAQFKSVPKLIAETHSPEKLVNLVEKKVLVSAIVPRFDFPAPGPRKPKTGREWFDRYFQILTPDSALPSTDSAP